ncbi:zinc finger protein 184-like [Helicoverpa zea]|uniref:zinc finger protein 184-like n=1 Tax=Helicoverpa zea TaxID=7113 RepID=UPI001F5920A1|nr:zinc finger protein 184-like [Helicoverpa zea]
MSASSKLIIHKFEAAGVNFKSLHISIEDEGSSTPSTKYSKWLDGKVQEKKKETDKSSRLVVKIVSGNDFDRFNLDASAKAIESPESYITNVYSESSMLHKDELTYKLGEKDQDISYYHEESRDTLLSNQQTFETNIRYENDLQFYLKNKCKLNNPGIYLSPLEHSLEKVKENNARIMENIHMLNRTLNYTKKKEILDIVCPKTIRSFPCNTCGKCFVYETGLRRHYSMRHAMAEAQPRWQVVWTCIQCFQVWPRQDQALKHSSECCKSNNADCVREIKTSSLLQCEFCEKVFTSIPRLLRHSKNHTTANNYECNACGMSFISYKTAEQHWILCPWLNMYYSFSLPKLLLCNACDRKFRNYEQLYNHRYKVGHFMTKTHQDSSKSLGILVYQCEICGQWYSSTAPLKVHKNQFHPKHDMGLQCRMDKTYQDNQNYCISNENEVYVNQGEEIMKVADEQ